MWESAVTSDSSFMLEPVLEKLQNKFIIDWLIASDYIS